MAIYIVVNFASSLLWLG